VEFRVDDGETRNPPSRLTAGPAGLKIPAQKIKMRPTKRRSRIVRIDRHDARIGRGRLEQTVQLVLRLRLVVERIDIAAFTRDRHLKPWQSFVVAAELVEDGPDIVAKTRIARIERISSPAVGEAVLELPEAAQTHRTQHKRRDVVGLSFDKQIERCKCVLPPAEIDEEIGEVQIRDGALPTPVRPQVVVEREGLVEAPQLSERDGPLLYSATSN